MEGKKVNEFEQYLPRNVSIEDLRNQEELNTQFQQANINNIMRNQKSGNKLTVNPPAIIQNSNHALNQKSSSKTFQTNEKINE